MAEREDLKNIGLSSAAHEICSRLKEDGFFQDMVEAYRFAVALGIRQRQASAPFSRKNMYDVGGVDPSQVLRNIIVELFPEQAERPYAYMERLADAAFLGVGRLLNAGEFRLADVLHDERPQGNEA